MFQLGQYVHPYEQQEDDPQFRFIPTIIGTDKGLWGVLIERDNVDHPEVDNTIRALELERIYNMHGPLEVKDIMDFARAYRNSYLRQIHDQMCRNLCAEGFSQEDVYRMLFGTESIPSKFLDRPLSKLKHDFLQYLGII